MTWLRPEVTDALHKGQGVLAAGGVILAGLWLVWLGGYLLVPVGLLVIGLGTILALMARRRMRFAQDVAAPGLVELDEAQVGYLGPGDGGFLSLEELVELRLMRLNGKRMWRLKQADGQALLIPVEAQGADRLFDAFASLPGMDTRALVAALDQTPAVPGLAETHVIWRRAAFGKLARARPPLPRGLS